MGGTCKMGEWRPMIHIECERESWRREAKNDSVEGGQTFLKG